MRSRSRLRRPPGGASRSAAPDPLPPARCCRRLPSHSVSLPARPRVMQLLQRCGGDGEGHAALPHPLFISRTFARLLKAHHWTCAHVTTLGAEGSTWSWKAALSSSSRLAQHSPQQLTHGAGGAGCARPHRLCILPPAGCCGPPSASPDRARAAVNGLSSRQGCSGCARNLQCRHGCLAISLLYLTPGSEEQRRPASQC